MEKNYPKYNSYYYAYSRINSGIELGFYLEAITIEESILTDRLYPYAVFLGFSATKEIEKITLGQIIRQLEMNTTESDKHGFIFFEDLRVFWLNRSKCIHEVVKSYPGQETQDIEEFVSLAKDTAISGKELSKKISTWTKNFRKNKEYEEFLTFNFGL